MFYISRGNHKLDMIRKSELVKKRARVTESVTDETTKVNLADLALLGMWGYSVNGLSFEGNIIKVTEKDIKGGIVSKAQIFNAPGVVSTNSKGLICQDLRAEPIEKLVIPNGIQIVSGSLKAPEQGGNFNIKVPNTVKSLSLRYTNFYNNDFRLLSINFDNLDDINCITGSTLEYTRGIEFKKHHDKLCIHLENMVMHNGNIYIPSVCNFNPLHNYRMVKLNIVIDKLSFGYLESWENYLPRYISIKELDFSPYVTNIASYAFCNCKGLKKVNLGTKLKYIQARTFEGCQDLEEVIFSDCLEYIGEKAFKNCKSLKRVELPPSVKQIDCLAFADCGLEYIKLPKSCSVETGAISWRTPHIVKY